MISHSLHVPPTVVRLDGLVLDGLAIPDPVSPEAARRYCRQLATRHYENFTVASWLLPKGLRQHFYNIYAFCRWADDLADEPGDPAVSLKWLAWWDEELQVCFQGAPRHPVFVALAETIRAYDIPIDPFRDLLTAFIQDQRVRRYATYDDLLRYCQSSANPVGRLVLYLCGYRDAERQTLSDATCTALQLTNFWQDITLDLLKDRIYLPLDDLARFGYTEEDLLACRFDHRFAALMRFEVERTRALFEAGLQLCDRVDRRVRLDIELFSRGGLKILEQIERQGYDVLTHRPSLSSAGKIRLMLWYAVKLGIRV